MPHPLIMTKISENVLIVSRCPRIPGYFGTCADSVYQALLFPPPREARASSYAGKIGTGDEASPRGGFPIIRHNEIRDVTATMLTEVCHDVLVEPDLQPLSGEVLARASSIRTDGARLDIAVNGLWGGRFERSFLDVRVFNPHAPSNRNSTISSCYRKHELEKKRAYEQRLLEVEHSSFTPLVLSATGGMARQATILYKRLASLLADKWDQPYSSTLCWVRSRLAFSLLRSAIQYIRGARSSVGHAIKSIPPIDLVNAEAQLRLP